MSLAGKLVAGVALLSILSGCASYRQVSLPGPPVEHSDGRSLVVAEPGTRVRVTMNSGEERYGQVVQVTESEIVLGRQHSGDVEEQPIPASEIYSIEIEKNSVTRNVLLVAIVAAAAGIGFWAQSFAAGMGSMN
ncbi:MAG: hypothetical protein IPH48_16170 [bacterium]|jgi:hypothetical protein|nr:hypothetical protein [bacterium]